MTSDFSIEELCGIPDFIETHETKSMKRKRNAEIDMQFFDVLPDKIRDFLNESDVAFESSTAAAIYKNLNFNEKDTLNEIMRRCNDYKRRTFRYTR